MSYNQLMNTQPFIFSAEMGLVIVLIVMLLSLIVCHMFPNELMIFLLVIGNAFAMAGVIAIYSVQQTSYNNWLDGDVTSYVEEHGEQKETTDFDMVMREQNEKGVMEADISFIENGKKYDETVPIKKDTEAEENYIAYDIIPHTIDDNHQKDDVHHIRLYTPY